jgi:hypothetical protein
MVRGFCDSNSLLATATTTSPECEFCKIDIYATLLTFPTVYVTSTVYATTYGIYTTYADGSTIYSTETIFAPVCPSSCVETPVSTWVAFDVVLTSGTTYLACVIDMTYLICIFLTIFLATRTSPMATLNHDQPSMVVVSLYLSHLIWVQARQISPI